MRKLMFFNIFMLISLSGVLGYLISYPYDVKLQTVIISVLFLVYLKFFLYSEKKSRQK